MSQEITVEFVADRRRRRRAELDRLTQALREEILQVDDVDSVDPAPGAGPRRDQGGRRGADRAADRRGRARRDRAGKVIETVRGWFAAPEGGASPPRRCG